MAPPILSKRRAARLAAVQALYQIEVSNAAAEAVVREFDDHRLKTLLEPLELDLPEPKVDREWFRLVVLGAWSARERLDPAIEACLAAGWTLARLGYLLRATLRAGAFELESRTDIPVRVAITEYVEVAHLFLGGSEPGFVNAVLDRLSRTLRQADAAL